MCRHGGGGDEVLVAERSDNGEAKEIAMRPQYRGHPFSAELCCPPHTTGKLCCPPNTTGEHHQSTAHLLPTYCRTPTSTLAAEQPAKLQTPPKLQTPKLLCCCTPEATPTLLHSAALPTPPENSAALQIPPENTINQTPNSNATPNSNLQTLKTD
ncbi:hypothetical protein LOK49_LG08G00916 [Camellia lanceoleosa]|uniref:Uncharacterized protein n=1 Tax=Camellia lanceoleosa TaxID=1840588 RepID=A0ACC0GVV9_9ERIC|nr:hypothetical protein LOK49_LG08G00916 [Camellia lanceoleosa]